MDLISRDAAIAAIEAVKRDFPDTEWVIDDAACTGLSRAVREVSALPSPWVSVNDRLPNHGEYVLVYADSIELGAFDSHENSFYHFWDGTKDDIYGVTHWMELPAPPSD